MILVDDAIDIILSVSMPTQAIQRNAKDSLNCVSSCDAYSAVSVPGFEASVMDGYAVISTDTSRIRSVIGRITAGIVPSFTLIVGEAAYITTGSMIPPGCDAVVRIEDTKIVSGSEDEKGEEVEIMDENVFVGKFIRHTASDVGIGDVVCVSGSTLNFTDVGLLSSVGVKDVDVFRPPIVCVMSTGDELVNLHDHSQANDVACVIDCNRPSLIHGLGQKFPSLTIVDLGIVKDDEISINSAISRALDCGADVIISSGGVSMGCTDYVKKVISQQAGCVIHFSKLLMKPGKPSTFATFDSRRNFARKVLYFGLPGNPASCIATRILLVDPAIRRLSGINLVACKNPIVRASLGYSVKPDSERFDYQRVILSYKPISGFDAGYQLVANKVAGHQGSSRIQSFQHSNGFAIIPPSSSQTQIPVGAIVQVVVFDEVSHSSFAAVSSVTTTDTHEGTHSHDHDHHDSCSHNHSHDHSNSREPSSSFEATIRVNILTVSDRAHAGIYEDRTGPSIEAFFNSINSSSSHGSVQERFDGRCRFRVNTRVIVPDEVDHIRAKICEWADLDGVDGVDLILTNGGTGFSPRDITPEAVKGILDREAPGLALLGMLQKGGLMHTDLALLSRPVAGVRKKTLILTLPGSSKGSIENLTPLIPLIPAIVALLRGKQICH